MSESLLFIEICFRLSKRLKPWRLAADPGVSWKAKWGIVNAHSLIVGSLCVVSKCHDWLIIESSPSSLFNVVCQQTALRRSDRGIRYCWPGQPNPIRNSFQFYSNSIDLVGSF